jgi:hypothetical protein
VSKVQSPKSKARCSHPVARWNETQIRCGLCGAFIERADERHITRRWPSALCLALFTFCLLPSAFCLGQDWQPSTRTASYPGPVCQWLRGQQQPQRRQVPQRQQQRAPTDPAASVQPQLPSVYQSPPAQPAIDLSGYVKRPELAAYATKADLDGLRQATTASVEQHTGVINQLIQFTEGLARAAKDSTDDAAGKLADVKQKLDAVNSVVQKAADTPAGQAAEKAAGNWIEQAAGAQGLTIAKLALATGGPAAAIAAVLSWLAYRRLRSKLTAPSTAAPAAPGGGAPADPFRRADGRRGQDRGRARPTASTDGNADAAREYPSHR